MSLFKRKTSVKPETDEDNERIVHDFTLRTPFWHYRAVPYQGYAPLFELKTTLDSHLDALFSGDIDSGNGDVLDGMIFDVVRQAKTDLDRQRAAHLDKIKSLGIRPSGDYAQFEEQLNCLQADLGQNAQEQALVRELLHRDEYKEDR